MGIYSSFIPNCPKLETTKLSFTKWMDKETVVYPYSAVLFRDKGNELLCRKRTWRKLKCILLSERSQSEKVTYCMIPSMWHSEKGKIIQTIRKSMITRLLRGGREEWIGISCEAQEIWGQWDYYIWFCNSAYMTLYVCQNS